MKEPLYLLDGYGVIYRAYFAFIRQPMRNRDGKKRFRYLRFFPDRFQYPAENENRPAYRSYGLQNKDLPS